MRTQTTSWHLPWSFVLILKYLLLDVVRSKVAWTDCWRFKASFLLVRQDSPTFVNVLKITLIINGCNIYFSGTSDTLRHLLFAHIKVLSCPHSLLLGVLISWKGTVVIFCTTEHVQAFSARRADFWVFDHRASEVLVDWLCSSIWRKMTFWCLFVFLFLAYCSKSQHIFFIHIGLLSTKLVFNFLVDCVKPFTDIIISAVCTLLWFQTFNTFYNFFLRISTI